MARWDFRTRARMEMQSFEVEEEEDAMLFLLNTDDDNRVCVFADCRDLQHRYLL